MARYLECDRCGVKYEDEESITMAQEMAEQWRTERLADGVEARGIAPCPNISCRGELVLKEAEKKIAAQGE